MRFKKIIIALNFIILGLLGSKVYSSENSPAKMNKEERKSLNESTKKSLIDVLEANEKLHSAFFNYDGKKVEENALIVKNKIDKIEDKEISKLLKFTKVKLSELKASNDREINNKNYNLVSMALIHIVNKYDIGKKYNAYSCPMVKKKWVQNSKKMDKVHNPYAKGMPHCGTKDSDY